MISPQDAAAKWASNLSNATNAIKLGVQGVTTNPAQKAAAAVDQWAQGVQRAVANGSFVRGLSRVSLQDWQNAMLSKGVPRIATGAVAAKQKMTDFMSQWLPFMEQGKAMLSSMPRGTLDQNIQRAVAIMQHNATFQRR